MQQKALFILPVVTIGLMMFSWLDYQNTTIINAAKKNFVSGEFDLAFEQLSKASSIIPIDAASWRLWGRISMSAGIFRQQENYANNSIKFLQKAVMLEPNEAANYLYLGVALQVNQENQLAREALLNALARDPYNANYLYNYGLLLEQQGQAKAAALYYQKSLTVRESLVVKLALERVQKANQ